MKLSRRYLSLFCFFYLWLPNEAASLTNANPSIGISNSSTGNIVLEVWTNWDLGIVEAANFFLTNPPTWSTTTTQLSSPGAPAQKALLSMDPFTGTAAVVWVQQTLVNGSTVDCVYGIFYYNNAWQPLTLQILTDNTSPLITRSVNPNSLVINRTENDTNIVWIVAWSEVRLDTLDTVISSTYGKYDGVSASWTFPAVEGPSAG